MTIADMTQPEPNSGCLLWLGAVHPRDGYGMVSMGPGRKTAAHRQSYAESNGPIPPGMMVLHGCDTRLCVEPSHLRLGTHADNVADMVRKNRQARGSATASCKPGRRSLSRDEALAIKMAPSARGLARQFGVGKNIVNKIRRGLAWRDLP